MDLITNLPTDVPVVLDHFDEKQLTTLADGVMSLLNLSGVDMGRATHYSTKEEMEEARIQLHRNVFEIDRSVYGCIFCLPGVTDFGRMKAVTALLSNPWRGSDGVLTPQHEISIIDYLLDEIQSNRMFNLFVALKEQRVNNSRTRSIIMKKILNSGLLYLWSIKYRHKLKAILEHVWTVQKTGVIKSILAKDQDKPSDKERYILDTYIDKYLNRKTRKLIVYQCISWILGNRIPEQYFPLAKEFEASKADLKAGKNLPDEVLEGIRSTFHKDAGRDEVIETTKGTMTTKKKRLIQKSAKKAGVKVEFDPKRQPMVDLYIYMFEMGSTQEIESAVREKARTLAKTLPFYFDHVGIIVDTSISMSGSKEQKLRPLATALATRDMLAYSGDKATILTSEEKKSAPSWIHFPKGETDLAGALAKMFKSDPDSIFIISDGYENAPAGRVAEVVAIARDIGITTPIYHINPVAAAESKVAIRQLDKEIPVMPIKDPQGFGLTLFKAMLENDPKRGLVSLIGMALPLIGAPATTKEVTAS